MSDKQLKNKAINIKGKAYVLVADRINYFNQEYPNGAIQTEELENEQRVEFKATVIPDVDKPIRFFTGHSQAVWGDGMVNKTAATENAETSAVGRALAMMGIGVIESIASADELNKAQAQPSTGKFATAKQIDWLRKEAMKISGLELGEDIDKWIEEIIGAPPQKLGIRSVMRAVERIQAAKPESQPLVTDGVEVTDVALEELNNGKLPY